MPAQSSNPGIAAPAASPSTLDLQRAVDDMTRLVQELREAEKTARRRAFLGTLLLIVLILAFALLTYNKVRDNFAQDKLQRAATEHARLLMPQLQPHVQAMMNDVAPYYSEMGQQRLKALSPKLDARVRQQADQLGAEMEKKINAQVEASFGRIMNVVMAKLMQDFPAITQDGGTRATERLKAAMNAETGKLAEHTRSMYKVQSDRIATSLARFPVPDVRKTEMDVLQRQLLHDLLMFADYELTAGGNLMPPAPVAAAPTK